MAPPMPPSRFSMCPFNWDGVWCEDLRRKRFGYAAVATRLQGAFGKSGGAYVDLASWFNPPVVELGSGGQERTDGGDRRPFAVTED